MAGPLLMEGHRGARGLRPENTLPSFEAALDAGAAAVETDVHLTADGVPVLLHDPTLQDRKHRLGPAVHPAPPSPRFRPSVHRLTAAQLAAYVADRNPDATAFPEQAAESAPLAAAIHGDAEYAIPTLADLYRFVAAYAGDAGKAAGKTDAQRANAARVIIDVELKRVPFRADDWNQPDGRMEQQVLDVIRAAGAVGRTWVRSFDHRCVRRLRQLEPGLTGVVLVEGTTPVDPAAVVWAADAQVYAPDFRFLDEEQVRQCRDAGIRVVPWTVNDPADWARLVGWGVDGITTDYPDRLAVYVSRSPSLGSGRET